MEEKLTELDYDMIDYFYFEKGDLERWSGWENKKHLVAKEHPELFHALKQLKIAQKTVHSIIKNICGRNC